MTTAMLRDQLEGREVYTSDNEKLGKVEEIYYDEATNASEWIAVKAGFLGMKRLLVPVEGATMRGDDVQLAYTKEQLENAPDIDDTRFESDDDERTIYGHYGMEYPGRSFGYGDEDAYRRADHTDNDSIVRHEEEVNVGKREVNAGSVRLRKWVETKAVSEDVPLRRETAHIEREPINERVSGGQIGEQEVRVDLTSEEAVVSKETIAKERVRLDKDVTSDVKRVDETVREEHVEIDRDKAHTR